MWKSFLTFRRRIRCRVLHLTGGKYLKKRQIDAKHHNSLVCAGPGEKNKSGGPPHSAQSSGLGVRAPDAFPFWAISTSAPRFRAFQNWQEFSSARSARDPAKGSILPLPARLLLLFCVFLSVSALRGSASFRGGRRSAEVELLADLMHCHAVGVAGGGFADSLDGLEIGLAAEIEGLVVDGEEKLGAGVLGHLPSLLGVAVRTDPRAPGSSPPAPGRAPATESLAFVPLYPLPPRSHPGPGP